MTYPVFTNGDILDADDMNAVGLWKIGGAAFTTTTGFNLPNGSFSATYRNYRLVVNITAVATDADFTGRLRASGTNVTSADYQTAFSGVTAGAVSINLAGINGTSFNLGESDNSVVVYNLTLDILNPEAATRTAILGQLVTLNKAADATRIYSGGGFLNLTTSYDSFAFISSQNVTGDYVLYGYRN